MHLSLIHTIISGGGGTGQPSGTTQGNALQALIIIMQMLVQELWIKQHHGGPITLSCNNLLR